MKTEHWNILIKTMLVLVLNIPIHLQAQYTKSFTGSFNGIENLTLTSGRGDIVFKKSTDENTKYELNVSLEAKTEADANIIFSGVDVKDDHNGQNLSLSTKFNFKNINTINGRSSITLQNGKRAKNITQFKVKLIVYTPELASLRVAVKYHQLDIPDGIARQLDIETYNNKVNIGSVSGELNVKSKYTKGIFGSAGKSNLDLYDCNLTFQKLGDVQLASKYSELEFESLSSLTAQTYEDNIIIPNSIPSVKITDKYSVFTIQDIRNAWLDLYETKVTISKIHNARIKSKYTKYKLGTLETFDLEMSYEDKINLQSVATINISESKYSELHIQKVTTRFNIASYNDKINIEGLAPTFEAFSFTGKYSKLNVDLNPKFAYHLKATTKYGRLVVDKDQLDITTWIEKSDQLTAEGKTKNANRSSAIFTIEGYDNNISL
ncbi:MAG: hypothetical protein HRU40_01125 [Saprospiraceae bacterium]|nr:hypothetical protein [Saprospiraceae bacterium]